MSRIFLAPVTEFFNGRQLNKNKNKEGKCFSVAKRIMFLTQ